MRLRNPNSTKKRKKEVADLSRHQNCYEGERLDELLRSIKREVESEKLLNEALPEKIWLKQQFAVGVNDVTRVLERMAPSADSGTAVSAQNPGSKGRPSTQLQAIILACDCNPRWLTRHVPGLAESRKVPVILVKDGKRGSLRLGEVVQLKTAIALGIKVKGNSINRVVEEILLSDDSSS
uniref:Ribosomal protein eL8/eL30/eS12/Gadd45 domain-containing protein n=1 Tax=Kalanchoe fedtschenkoi TaxID=63787 RepID=A0A7N0UTC6_KALFE